MEEIKYKSLFEFLGKPADGELGKRVYTNSQEHKVKTQTQDISTPNYKGKVMMYPTTFLEQYFNKHGI